MIYTAGPPIHIRGQRRVHEPACGGGDLPAGRTGIFHHRLRGHRCVCERERERERIRDTRSAREIGRRKNQENMPASEEAAGSRRPFCSTRVTPPCCVDLLLCYTQCRALRQHPPRAFQPGRVAVQGHALHGEDRRRPHRLGERVRRRKRGVLQVYPRQRAALRAVRVSRRSHSVRSGTDECMDTQRVRVSVCMHAWWVRVSVGSVFLWVRVSVGSVGACFCRFCVSLGAVFLWVRVFVGAVFPRMASTAGRPSG